MIRLVVIAFVVCGWSRATHAQQADSSNVCFGFQFGVFAPPLDRVVAGHPALADSVLQRAPGGRDWASDLGRSSDTTLVLFPGWWPAGVVVDLTRRPAARGDTVNGTARAFVANGQVTSPRATVRAWRVDCQRR
jgi:hypothetical protein